MLRTGTAAQRQKYTVWNNWDANITATIQRLHASVEHFYSF